MAGDRHPALMPERSGGAAPTTLPRDFYAGSALDVAPLLLNKLLVHDDPQAGRLVGRIVEVEAYLGSDDPASHAYRGPTPRVVTMFGPPGHLYVYFTYGMHWCANVVCSPPGRPGAVLLRALTPLVGIEAMRTRRPRPGPDWQLCSGPARLTRSLGLGRPHDGADLVDGPVRILDDEVPPPPSPAVSGRIGVGRAADRPWRFCVPGESCVSRRSPARPMPPPGVGGASGAAP